MPRSKNTNPTKKHFTYTIKDSFKEYNKQERERKVSYKQYKGILIELFAAIIRKVIREDWTFYIPEDLGALTVVSTDQTKTGANPINYKETREKGKPVYHLNFESFRRVYTVKWINSFVRFRNKKYFTYSPMGTSLSKRHNTGKSEIHKKIKRANIDPDTKLIK
jgi:hypothetical protein